MSKRIAQEVVYDGCGNPDSSLGESLQQVWSGCSSLQLSRESRCCCSDSPCICENCCIPPHTHTQQRKLQLTSFLCFKKPSTSVKCFIIVFPKIALGRRSSSTTLFSWGDENCLIAATDQRKDPTKSSPVEQ